MKFCTKIIIVFIVFSNQLVAQKTKEKNNICLEIIGIPLTDKNPLDGVNVTLYEGNEKMEKTEIVSVTDHENRFNFQLQRDLYYTIEIAKAGYVSRVIAISTKLPKNIISEPVFRYEFEVDLFREKKGINDDSPVALIDYDVKTEVFFLHGR